MAAMARPRAIRVNAFTGVITVLFMPAVRILRDSAACSSLSKPATWRGPRTSTVSPLVTSSCHSRSWARAAGHRVVDRIGIQRILLKVALCVVDADRDCYSRTRLWGILSVGPTDRLGRWGRAFQG